MGLPDLSPVHDAYVTRMVDTVQNGVTPDVLAGMMKSWVPMGDTGMKLWQTLLEQATSPTKG